MTGRPATNFTTNARMRHGPVRAFVSYSWTAPPTFSNQPIQADRQPERGHAPCRDQIDERIGRVVGNGVDAVRHGDQDCCPPPGVLAVIETPQPCQRQQRGPGPPELPHHLRHPRDHPAGEVLDRQPERQLSIEAAGHERPQRGRRARVLPVDRGIRRGCQRQVSINTKAQPWRRPSAARSPRPKELPAARLPAHTQTAAPGSINRRVRWLPRPSPNSNPAPASQGQPFGRLTFSG